MEKSTLLVVKYLEIWLLQLVGWYLLFPFIRVGKYVLFLSDVLLWVDDKIPPCWERIFWIDTVDALSGRERMSCRNWISTLARLLAVNLGYFQHRYSLRLDLTICQFGIKRYWYEDAVNVLFLIRTFLLVLRDSLLFWWLHFQRLAWRILVVHGVAETIACNFLLKRRTKRTKTRCA